MKEVGKQWLLARDIIAQALKEINGLGKRGEPSEQDKLNAAAIIARLAGNDPPILLAYADEIKD